MAETKLSETLDAQAGPAPGIPEGAVAVTRWPEYFGKWSSYMPDAEITLTREEAVALRDYLNTVLGG